tara:strand:- start:943 stop:1872 length:930 start_codon:yes stop_codon:yes gene_type:complete
MIIYSLQFLIGAFFLFYGSDYLINGSKGIANKFNVKPIIIAITIVALGTSLPELIVSVLANLKGQEGMVIGNVMGSNIANIGLVLGVISIITTIKYPFEKIANDLYFLLIVTILPILFFVNGRLFIWHGIIFLLLLFIYSIYLIKHNKLDGEKKSIVINENSLHLITKIILGIIGLTLGSNLFVEGAIGIAELLGVSDLVIGMSIVALGTSLPELATSLIAIKYKETDFLIGNIIGSNIMNITLVLGSSLLFGSIYVEYNTILFQMIFILVLTFGLFFLLKTSNQITKLSGIIFVAVYIVFLFINFQAI